MFGFKKDKPSTLDEVRKAYENLSDEDKQEFKQSLTDRVDESVGEQEAENDQKDEQPAKDRVDEAVGEEKAEDKELELIDDGKDEAETDDGEQTADETAEERAEEKHEEAQEEKHDEAVDANAELREVVAALAARIEALEKESKGAPKKASDEEVDYLTALERKYNN